jgi:hypothetical protein
MRPQRGDGDNAIVDLAHRVEILTGDMVGGAAILPIASIINDEHAIVGGRSQRISAEQLQGT